MTANLSTLRKFARRLLGRNGGNNAELQQRRHAVAAQKTDYRRWTDAKNYNPQWATRSHLAIELLGDARWVCDLGCGAQDLRKLLPSDSFYLPMDLKKWTEETLVCDINNKVLPPDYLEASDVCFVMGVLEYIYDGRWFLNELALSAEVIVISYNVAELCKVTREDNGWVNNLTTEQFKNLIEGAGYRIEDTRLYENARLIIRATNPAFGQDARAARDAGRQRLLEARAAKIPAQ